MIYPTLTQEITKVKTPKISEPISNNDTQAPSITITWTPVENATNYKVEYISANDYLAGKTWNSNYVFGETTYKLDLEEENKKNNKNMHYVFRVTANVIQNRKTIASDVSNEVEGIVINDFTLNCYALDNKLTITEKIKNKSVLDPSKKITTLEIQYYKGDCSDLSQSLDESASIPNINEVVLASAEEMTFTAVLYIEGKQVVRKAFTVKNPIDYNPPKLESMDEPSVEDGKIKISWTSKAINAGLVDTQLKFEVQRKVIERAERAGNTWQSIKEDDGSIKYFTDQSYVDEAVEPNKDYCYRIISHYFFTLNGVDYQTTQNYDSLIETDPAHIPDTKVDSFIVSYDKESWKTTDKSENATYEVALSWSPIHELPKGFDYLVTRFSYNEISAGDTSKGETVYVGKDMSIIDAIKLDKAADQKQQSYLYYIQIVPEGVVSYDASLPNIIGKFKEGGQGVITTEPTISPVNFLMTDKSSLYVTGGDDALASTIQIHWALDGNALEKANLKSSLVGVKIYRVEENTTTLITQGCTDDNFAIWGQKGVNLDPKGTFYFEDKAKYENGVKGIEAGISYQYQIVAFYADPNSPYYGEQTLITIEGTGNALNAVENIQASVNTYNDKIEVKWMPVANAKGYNIYYKEKETTSFSDPIKVPLSEEDMSKETLTYQLSGLKTNTLYEITVTATDEKGNDIIKDGNTVEGSVLGAIMPTVENKAKSIKLSWDAIPNATDYTIMIYDSADLSKPLLTSIPSAVKNVEGVMWYEYEISSDSQVITLLYENEKVTDKESILSQPYYFVIAPKNGKVVALSDNIERVEGHWNLAPTGITATKGAYRDLIKIEWNNVEGNKGYKLYRRVKGSNGPWTFVQMIPQDITLAKDTKNIQNEYEYTVSSFVNNEEGPIQVAFAKDSNIGYPILAPTQFVVTDMSTKGGKEYFTYQFEKVMEETEYVISVWNETITIDLSDETKNRPEIEPGNFQIDKNGYVTYIGKRLDVKELLDIDASIYTVGKNASDKDKCLSFPAKDTKQINYIKDYEVVNILNTILQQELLIADNKFGGDWWVYNLTASRNVYISEKGNGYFCAQTAYSIGSSSISNKTSGKLDIGKNGIPYIYNSYTLQTENTVTLWADESDTALATNPLKHLTGSFVLTFPSDYPAKKIRMQSFMVSQTVTETGTQTSIIGEVYIVDGSNEYKVDTSRVSVPIL